MTNIQTLTSLLETAWQHRQSFLQQMHQESTDCYRLFHGSVEGFMGLTVDRYGNNLLIQSFHQSLSADEINTISDFYQKVISNVNNHFYHNRSKDAESKQRQCLIGNSLQTQISEAGLHYYCDMQHSGQDPLLFLDFRAARRKVRQISHNKSVLNCFSFSCGIGIAAAAGQASRVHNVDFSSSALSAGEKSLALNALDQAQTQFIKEDYFLAVRQMAGLSLPVRQQRGMKGIKRYPQQSFDLVVLDPPRWSKSRFGTVDLIRDYNSVFKPALLATKPQGQILCTNNVAQVDKQIWLDNIQRCCEKNAYKINRIEFIDVDEDFPSFDNNTPLKQVLLSFN